MCGIAGLRYLDDRPASPSVVQAMTDSLAHRGPDGQGIWSADGIALGHRRLAIRDLSDAGAQPMRDPEDRVVVSYNGEIYNDQQLRRELEHQFGYNFISTCDSEVIPAGYLAWGDDFFAKIQGMFAIALWDVARRRLVLVRDGVGIKPLFWSRFGEVVRFGSEIKALLADPQHPRKIDPRGLHRFLGAGYAGPDATTVAGVKQVRPGTILSFENGGMEEKCFWKPSRSPVIHTMEDALEALIPILENVVVDHMVSDVPVAVLQSGGVDSSLLTMSAAQSTGLKLLTASFAEKTHDESYLARSVAAKTGLPHQIIPVGEDVDPSATLRRVVHHFDGQICDESSGPLLLLTEALRKHAVVALSGDGGDEFFGGYPTYRATRFAGKIANFIPKKVAETLGRQAYRMAVHGRGRLPLMSIASRFLMGIAVGGPYAHAEWRRYLPHFLIHNAYGRGLGGVSSESPMEAYRQVLKANNTTSFVERGMLADQSVHLPAGLLIKTDAMSMANGVEVRVPLLDRRITELSGACSVELLAPVYGQTKPVLRQALRRLGGPEDVVTAHKQGFNNPLASLMRNELRDICDSCFERSGDLLAPYLQPDFVRKLWEDHKNGHRNHAYGLWPILHFVIWREKSGAD